MNDVEGAMIKTKPNMDILMFLCDNFMVNTLEEGLCFDSDKDQKDTSTRKLVTEKVGLRKDIVIISK